ncbi:MAG: hypothetical protein IT486_07060 [Gammaproteobacteria bacterium]|nr:hypothetical protein [Gammaproteobacteria bacterium]
MCDSHCSIAPWLDSNATTCSATGRAVSRFVQAFICALVVGTGAAHGGQAPAAAAPVTGQYFGLHLHDADTVTPWPEVEFGSWRLWDARVAWTDIQPTARRWEFERLDRYADLADAHGVELVLPLGLSPPWASARPTEPSAYGPGKAAEPRDLSAWRGYVERVALRYRGRIRVFELWNEPNLAKFFSGTPETMLMLAREAHAIIKRVDPQAIVVSPSATGFDRGTRWLNEYLALGGAQYADVIGFHFYVSPQPPEAAVPVIARVREVLARHGVDKPLWNTEAGWVIENAEARADPTAVGFSADIRPVAPDLAAAYVSRFLILLWAGGVERNYWYAWDNKAMGLIEPKSRTLKPAARAYAVTAGWLRGAVVDRCRTSSDGVWLCGVTSPAHGQSWIVWRPAGHLRWAVPKDWAVKQMEVLDGVSRPLAMPAVVEIGPAPILVLPAP